MIHNKIKHKNKFVVLVVCIIVIIIGFVGVQYWNYKKVTKIMSFDECVAAGYPVMESFPPRCATPDGRSFTDQGRAQVEPGQIAIEGTFLCLPHKNQNGPQTLECAYGLQDEQGNYYVIRDADPTYQNISGVGTNSQVMVTGNFTQREDDKYQSIGIIEVTSVTPIE